MPRELYEIKLFQHGTMTTPDSADIPKDAASFSMNLRADASDGRLEGIQNDKIIVAPYTVSDQSFIECAASNKVIELLTSGFNMESENELTNGTTSANCGIKLFSQPANDVTLNITSNLTTSDDAECGINVSTASLTFTNSNYATIQNITFTAGSSNNANLGSQAVNIRFEVDSVDSNWDEKVFIYTIYNVANYDTGFEVQLLDMIIDEDDSNNTGSFKVRLKSRPVETVHCQASVSGGPGYTGGAGSGFVWDSGVNEVAWSNTTTSNDADYYSKWKTITFYADDDGSWEGEAPLNGWVQLQGNSDDSDYDGSQASNGYFYSAIAQNDPYMSQNYTVGEQLAGFLGVAVDQDSDNDPGGGDDDGGNDGNTCFEGNVMVSTPEGDVKISELTEGQEIYSWNKKRDKMVKNRVGKFLNHLNLETGYPIYKVTFGDGSYILSTSSHMYWNEDHSRYMQIENFNEGDRLRTDVGFFKTVKSNELWKEDLSQVYNFHTENAPHNYFANGVLVHNGGGEDILRDILWFFGKIGIMGNFTPIGMIHNPGGGGKRPRPDPPTTGSEGGGSGA